jgi:ABC-type uncharacterized transport system fused permease/ATPase subunit
VRVLALILILFMMFLIVLPRCTVKKKIMPHLGQLVARESELEGFYRTAHNRLITNSEEIAFYESENFYQTHSHYTNVCTEHCNNVCISSPVSFFKRHCVFVSICVPTNRSGSKKEKVIINNALQLICQHIAYHRYVKACVAVFDGLLVKYYASIAGYCTLLSPFIFARNTGSSTAELTRDYIRNSVSDALLLVCSG